MSNLQSVMKSNSVHSVNVPAVFLHYKDAATKYKRKNPVINHCIQIVDEGAYFKVVSHVDTYEIFFFDKKDIRHHHLNIDPCKCPFRRSNKELRGWKWIEGELKKEQGKMNSNVVPEKSLILRRIPRKVGRKIRHTKNKDADKNINNSPTKAPKPDAAPRTSGCAHLLPSRTTLENQYWDVNPLGKVQCVDLPLLDDIPSYICHQPINTASEVEPPSPSIFPPEASFLQYSIPDPLNIDISSVKGMIKQRKGELCNQGFNYNTFYEEVSNFSIRENENVNSDCFIQADLLNEEFINLPFVGDPSFPKIKPKSENLNDIKEISSPFFNLPVPITMNDIADVTGMNADEIRRSDKRRLEPDSVVGKRLKVDETLSHKNISAVRKPETPGTLVNSDVLTKPQESTIRLKDKSLLMNPVRGQLIENNTMLVQNNPHQHLQNNPQQLISNTPSTSKKVPETSSAVQWSERIQRRQKKISKRRVMFLKEQQDKQEQEVSLRQLSSTKKVGTALNSYWSSDILDKGSPFDMILPKVTEGYRNRCMCTLHHGSNKKIVDVGDLNSLEVVVPNAVWVKKKTFEERLAILKSLKRVQVHHPVFTPHPPNLKTDQITSEGGKEAVSDPEPSKSLTCGGFAGENPRTHLTRHDWRHLNPGSVDVFDPRTDCQDSPVGSAAVAESCETISHITPPSCVQDI